MSLRSPHRSDGQAMRDLVAACPPLDVNSTYLYVLLAEHFAETCIVAEDAQGLAGMVTGYCPPGRGDVLFVWQVAVHARARGQGLGRRMLLALLARDGLRGERWLETSVSPGNRASRQMFSRLAEHLGTPMGEAAFFDAALFGTGAHEAEPLLRMGPFTLPTPTRSTPGLHEVHTGENTWT